MSELKAGELVAVYGSLRKGKGNHRVLENSELVDTIRVKGFDMFSLGAYPYCVPDKNGEITVELYRIASDSVGKSLDILEGYPSFYDRKLISTPHGDAWIYFIDEYRDGTSYVEGGDWVVYKAYGGH